MLSAFERYTNAVITYLKNVSGNTLEWFAVICMHCAFVPSLMAVIVGVSDKLPTLDVVAFVWGGLFLLFIRATISKNITNILTIGLGFFAQAVLLAMVVFK